MKVLICPLNWGLGHATRCIPIIRQYLAEGNEILIASDGYPQEILKENFPELIHLTFKSYDIRYSSTDSQLGAMFRSLPRIFRGIISERLWIRKVVKKEKIDLIISDNRFGLWHKKVKSIYITHQLMIKMPAFMGFAEIIVWMGHRFFINRFTECLIPDFAGKTNLSGDLSHKYPLPANARFIGPLSRFEDPDNYNSELILDIFILISGPEPHRTIFEEQMMKAFENSDKSIVIVRGLPNENSLPDLPEGRIRIFNHLASDDLAKFILASKQIICRSGYTTIMDLYQLNCLSKADFHPTPGQTEQEYLKEHLRNQTNYFHKSIT